MQILVLLTQNDKDWNQQNFKLNTLTINIIDMYLKTEISAHYNKEILQLE